MKPSIGRIVLIHGVDPVINNGDTTAPAIIVRVWSDECINVKALLDGPEDKWYTSATPTSQVNWEWPPRV